MNSYFFCSVSKKERKLFRSVRSKMHAVFIHCFLDHVLYNVIFDPIACEAKNRVSPILFLIWPFYNRQSWHHWKSSWDKFYNMFYNHKLYCEIVTPKRYIVKVILIRLSSLVPLHNGDNVSIGDKFLIDLLPLA